jgi:predicted transcriptional regulator
MRLNARLDDEAARQVSYLTSTTGRSVSHVVREAIAAYHAQVKGQRAMPSRLLALAGTGDSGRSDMATRYKEHVVEAIAAKHRAFGLPVAQAVPPVGAKPERRRAR